MKMRQAEGMPGEREHLMHEFEWQKYFLKILSTLKLGSLP